MMLFGFTTALGAACDGPLGNADLHVTLTEATAAYTDFREAEFTKHVVELEGRLPCLTEVLAPAYAARIHRLRGLNSYLIKDYGGSELHFAAARRLEPDYTFPEAIAPDGNPVLDRYTSISLDGEIVALPVPARGTYRLDGSSLGLDPRLPAVFQRVASNGTVLSTEVMGPGAVLPNAGEKLKTKRSPALLIVGLAAMGAAAGTYGGALAAKSSFDKARKSGDTDALHSTFRTNRTLTLTSGALGAAGVSCVAAHFIIR